MRPRERAIRDQLRMIGQICRLHGVACLMNGDVGDRDSGVALAAEYGVDGAMIATAAEANSSAFRTRAAGGLAPWREVVEQYLRFALSVENKWGNTKFLLSQLVPGKDAVYQRITRSRSHVECFEILGLDEEMTAKAGELDAILGLDVGGPKPQRKQQQQQQQQQQRKRSHEEAVRQSINNSMGGKKKKNKKKEKKEKTPDHQPSSGAVSLPGLERAAQIALET